jgi:hypothetical protein
MTERQRQHMEALRGRRDDIAKHWCDAIAPTITGPDTVKMKVLLSEWTQRIITLLLAESLDRDRVQAIGAALARDISAEAQVLGKTQAVLAQHLTAGLPDEQIASLHWRSVSSRPKRSSSRLCAGSSYLRPPTI